MKQFNPFRRVLRSLGNAIKHPIVAVLACLVLVLGTPNTGRACYANYTHTNACAGDTTWFYGLDLSSVHSWDFGDTISGNPNTAYDDTVFHIYTAPGTYYVTHFNNIGAEWAFETQVVTVSVACFGAAFTPQCAGALSYTFNNTSGGQNLTYQWTFGDPASGADNTSMLLNPYHSYLTAGAYTVSLTISDGSQSDTYTTVVNADTACMTASISYMANPCATDTTHFYYYFTGVTNVLWNFGDPASGIANMSTDMNPSHVFNAPGLYVGYVIYTNGTNTDTLPVITNVVDCDVFPGDANRDGQVTGEDLFPIALYFDATGTARSSATTDFVGQACANWAGTSGAFTGDMYLNDMVNLKYADCNGDGVINALDVQAVSQNFGNVSHLHNTKSQMQLVPENAPTLGIAFSQDNYAANSGSADLFLGDATINAADVYGVCARIAYDPSVIDPYSISADFSNTWLDTVGLPHLITLFHNDVTNHVATVAMARTDHFAVSGQGPVATLSFGFLGTGGTATMNLEENSKVMRNAMFGNNGYIQNYVDVRLLGDAADVQPNSVNGVESSGRFSLYPSPTASDVYVRGVGGNGGMLTVYDPTGRAVWTQTITGTSTRVPAAKLNAGVYTVELIDNQGVTRSRFVKQ